MVRNGPHIKKLKQHLAENPLPERSYVLMSEFELKMLDFHAPAVAELQRRQARRKAKREGDMLALRETNPPKPAGTDEDLRLLVERLFTAAA
jgi:hypothetical protein